MSFKANDIHAATPWEALVSAWNEICACSSQDEATLQGWAQDCDAATRLVSRIEDERGELPTVFDITQGDGANATQVPFDWDDHISALMEASDRALTWT
jgi:hypothetical protein